MDAKTILLSLSLDLKRITTAIQRDSSAVEKFNDEAKNWLAQSKNLKDTNLNHLLTKIETTLKGNNDLSKAEDCLMYAFLLQNRALIQK